MAREVDEIVADWLEGAGPRIVQHGELIAVVRALAEARAEVEKLRAEQGDAAGKQAEVSQTVVISARELERWQAIEREARDAVSVARSVGVHLNPLQAALEVPAQGGA